MVRSWRGSDKQRWDRASGEHLTRSAFVRAGTGLAFALGGGGYGVSRLLDVRGRNTESTSPETRTVLASRKTPTAHRFFSRPDLMPPIVTATRSAGSLAEGLVFMTPTVGTDQTGVLLADNDGEPVWFRPTSPLGAADFRMAWYQGRPVLSWWEGTDDDGLGRGTHVIADDRYQVIARVPAGNGLPSDLHEFSITPSGTALVTSWELATRDLRRFRGRAKGAVVGGVVQELELPSGRVLFEWHSLDHVGLDESYSAFEPGYGYFDYFHINSIGSTDDGNLLVSARNTWTIYKIDRGSSEVIWRLGGKRNDFQMGPGTTFAWQHDARAHGHGLVSLFDDGAAPNVQPQSRGLVLAVDASRMRAALRSAYPHSPPLLATALGSTQVLPNGNVLVGYGTEPHITEFGADGATRLDLALPPGGQTYRAFRFPWTGRPTDQPRLAVVAAQLYASWNGASEVTHWQLRTGSSVDDLTPAMTLPRRGFETSLPMPPGARYAAVVALDAGGKPLGQSATVGL